MSKYREYDFITRIFNMIFNNNHKINDNEDNNWHLENAVRATFWFEKPAKANNSDTLNKNSNAPRYRLI